MSVLRFTVWGPPVPQARARVGKSGHHYTPNASRLYGQKVAYEALDAMFRQRWVRGLRGPFRVVLDVYRLRNAGDCDNYAKAIMDSLTKVNAWRDDRYVQDSTTRLHIDKESPRAEVTVELLVTW